MASKSMRNCRSKSSRGTSCPAAALTLVAKAEMSSFSPVARLTFMPTPSTAYHTVSPTIALSAKMPAALRPPISKSLGHLIFGSSPVTLRTALAAAIPPMMLMNGRVSRVGRNSTETSRLPGWDTQWRPWRPRPSDCTSATTTAPSSASVSPSLAASSMVEESSG